MIVLRVMLRVILLSAWSPIPHNVNRSHVNFWVGETRTELLEGTVAINLLLSWLIYMYVCLKPPTKKRRNPKVEEDSVECSTDLYR